MKPYRQSILVAIVLLASALLTQRDSLGGAVAIAQPAHNPPEKRWVGVTMPSARLEIGCAQDGVIEKMAVREGDAVAKGQLLFQLTTAEEQLEVERLRALATSDATVREAIAVLVQAEREESRYKKLHSQDEVSDSELDERHREAEVARIRVEQAKLAHRVADLNHRMAQARMAQRIVHSPIDGYVARRLRSAGESVEKLQPALEIVTLDPLWVEFHCPVADAALLPHGTEVRVRQAVDVASGGKEKAGAQAIAKVILAVRTADAASQTFRVRLVLQGESRGWKSGLKVHVEIGGR